MKTFIASISIYDNMEWRHVDKTKEFEAETKEEAEKLARQYCEDMSDGASDFYFEKIVEKVVA